MRALLVILLPRLSTLELLTKCMESLTQLLKPLLARLGNAIDITG